MLDLKTVTSSTRQKNKQKVANEIYLIIGVSLAIIIFAGVLIGPIIGNIGYSLKGFTPIEGGLADSSTNLAVWNSIQNYETINNQCSDLKSKSISIVQHPNSSGNWIEEWQVSTCGQIKTYKIFFTVNQFNQLIYTIKN